MGRECEDCREALPLPQFFLAKAISTNAAKGKQEKAMPLNSQFCFIAHHIPICFSRRDFNLSRIFSGDRISMKGPKDRMRIRISVSSSLS